MGLLGLINKSHRVFDGKQQTVQLKRPSGLTSVLAPLGFVWVYVK